MKQYSDTVSVELTFSEVVKMTRRAIIRAYDIMEDGAPLGVMKDYAMLAKKLNDVLKQNGFDHYTDEKFQILEEFIQKRGASNEI